MSIPAGLQALLAEHGRRRLLVDANLLLLYFVGCVERRLIKKCREQLSHYDPEDFQLLAQIIYYFQKREKVITTPHILAEVSNLSNELKGANRVSFFRVAADQIAILEELSEPARETSRMDIFPVLGLTDSAIVSLAAKRELLVLTADEPLIGDLRKRNTKVIRFSDLRYLCLAE